MINNSKIAKQLTKNIEDKILCIYKNISNSWQIVKITNIPNIAIKKAVFPGQKIAFEAKLQAKIRILSADNIKAMLTDTISCHKLIKN